VCPILSLSQLQLLIGCCTAFAQPDALKGSLVETLQEVSWLVVVRARGTSRYPPSSIAGPPDLFFGVPRVWEKIEEKMRAVGAANTGAAGMILRLMRSTVASRLPRSALSGMKKAIGEWAKRVGAAGSEAKLKGHGTPLLWPVANTIVRC